LNACFPALQTYNVIFYCSATVVDKWKGNREYPRIAANHRRSFDTLAKLSCDMSLAPHPGRFHMDDKRAKLTASGPNPFIHPGEMRACGGRSREISSVRLPNRPLFQAGTADRTLSSVEAPR
jgi:hypothetical protein